MQLAEQMVESLYAGVDSYIRHFEYAFQHFCSLVKLSGDADAIADAELTLPAIDSSGAGATST